MYISTTHISEMVIVMANIIIESSMKSHLGFRLATVVTSLQLQFIDRPGSAAATVDFVDDDY